MNSVRLKSAIEVVGILSVVGSLALVSFELRLTREVQIAQVSSDRTARTIELRNMSLDRGIGPIIRNIESGGDISPEEFDALFHYFYAYLTHFEDLFFQQQHGYMNEETWAAKQRGLRTLVNYTGFSLVADAVLGDGYQSGFEKSFLDLVRQLME